MGKTGAGVGEEQGVQDEVDLYFSTFAKSMASIGAFVSGDRDIVDNLRYKLRSQIFAKSLPMPIVIGNLKRLELIKNSPKFKDKLWEIVNAIQDGFKSNGFNIEKIFPDQWPLQKITSFIPFFIRRRLVPSIHNGFLPLRFSGEFIFLLSKKSPKSKDFY